MSDPDSGESSYRLGSYAGSHGVLMLDSVGEWTYAAANDQPAVQGLRQDESLTDSITVIAFDGATTAVTITIIGANDLPVLSTGIAEVREDIGVDGAGYLTASGILLVNGPDAGESLYQSGFYAGSYGALMLTGLGGWNYSADNDQASVQNLNTGDWLTDSISVRAFDGTATTVTITIQGADEAPVIPARDPVLQPPEPVAEPSSMHSAPEVQAPAAPEPVLAVAEEATSVETGAPAVAADSNDAQAVGDGPDVSVAAASQGNAPESMLNAVRPPEAVTTPVIETSSVAREETKGTAPVSAISPDAGAEAASDGPAETALVTAERQERPDLRQPAVTLSQESYGLSSWDITNALLQFHLEKNSASATDNVLASGYSTTRTLSGMGPGTEPLMLGLQGLGAESGQLQPFSGLQDGLRSLGEVGIG